MRNVRIMRDRGQAMQTANGRYAGREVRKIEGLLHPVTITSLLGLADAGTKLNSPA
jgi:hypothetical protein